MNTKVNKSFKMENKNLLWLNTLIDWAVNGDSACNQLHQPFFTSEFLYDAIQEVMHSPKLKQEIGKL